MRRLVTLGACSLAGALAMAGCGDDDVVPGGTSGSGNAGRAGSGGSGTAGAGMGGSSAGGAAGTPAGGNAGEGAGAAGVPNAGNGGNAGDPGDPPDGGDGGGGPPCTGCVELTVPVTGPNITSLFQFSNLGGVDFTDAVITFRIRALTLGDNFFVQGFSQDTTGFNFDATNSFRSLNAGGGFANTDDFVDLVYDLSAVDPAPLIGGSDAGADGGGGTPGTPDPAAFDKSSLAQFGLQVGAGAAFAGTGTVTVLIDSITIAGDGGEFDDVLFTVDAEGFAINAFAGSQDGVLTHHP